MSKKSIFIFMMITLVSVFVNRISAAYEEPEISYSAIPEYILVGQTASVKYTITVPGYENIEGTIKITGTKAGKGISFKASAQKIKYKHYFPNGGWHYAAATITPEVSIDVVDIENLTIKKNPDKLAEYIGKPVAANASTNPPGYEYLIKWSVTLISEENGNNSSEQISVGSGSNINFVPKKIGNYNIEAKVVNSKKITYTPLPPIIKEIKLKKIVGLIGKQVEGEIITIPAEFGHLVKQKIIMQDGSIENISGNTINFLPNIKGEYQIIAYIPSSNESITTYTAIEAKYKAQNANKQFAIIRNNSFSHPQNENISLKQTLNYKIITTPPGKANIVIGNGKTSCITVWNITQQCIDLVGGSTLITALFKLLKIEATVTLKITGGDIHFLYEEKKENVNYGASWGIQYINFFIDSFEGATDLKAKQQPDVDSVITANLNIKLFSNFLSFFSGNFLNSLHFGGLSANFTVDDVY